MSKPFHILAFSGSLGQGSINHELVQILDHPALSLEVSRTALRID
jgi:hypothetical protein